MKPAGNATLSVVVGEEQQHCDHPATTKDQELVARQEATPPPPGGHKGRTLVAIYEKKTY